MNNTKAIKRIIASLDGAPAINTAGKYVMFSDLHYNKDGGRNDSKQYLQNQREKVFPYYSRGGYKFIVGEGFDLVEAGSYDAIWDYHPNRDNIKMIVDNCSHYLVGNHEFKIIDVKHPSLTGLNFCNTLRMYQPDGTPLGFAQHGCQADKWNHGGNLTSAVNWIVRHIWAGWQDSTRAASNLDIAYEIEDCYTELAYKSAEFYNKPYVILIQHTHRAAVKHKGKGVYINSGCWVRPNGGHCVEIEHNCFRLVKWDILGNRKVERVLDI